MIDITSGSTKMMAVNGMMFGAGFTFAAILVVAAMKVIFHLGLC